jgi:hypothetical protein
MSKYDIVIKKIERKRHSGFRYELIVYWNRTEDRGDVSWAYTLWGARREAKRLIKKHELPKEHVEIVEEYQV